MKSKKLNLTILFLLITFFTVPGIVPAGELFDKVYQNDIEAVKKLLAEGVDINELSEVGGAGTVTSLFIACSYYDDMAKLLISKGADVNIKTGKGQTPLMGACASGKEEIARLLLSKGADVNVKSNDGTGTFTYCIMSIFSDFASTSLAELLLSKGANVDEASDTGPVAGYTPLMMAAVNKKHDLVKFLIKHGANVNAKAKDGSTPLSMATKDNDPAMVKLLKGLGAN
jgi:ankyrin repeat protein